MLLVIHLYTFHQKNMTFSTESTLESWIVIISSNHQNNSSSLPLRIYYIYLFIRLDTPFVNLYSQMVWQLLVPYAQFLWLPNFYKSGKWCCLSWTTQRYRSNESNDRIKWWYCSLVQCRWGKVMRLVWIRVYEVGLGYWELGQPSLFMTYLLQRVEAAYEGICNKNSRNCYENESGCQQSLSQLQKEVESHPQG